MKTIYIVSYKSRANQSNADSVEYYEDKLDAYKEANLDNNGDKIVGGNNHNEVVPVSLWEPGEANPVNRMKLAALEKLTEEEREALSVKYEPTFHPKVV